MAVLKHPEIIIRKNFRTYISLMKEIVKATHICTCLPKQNLIKIRLPESIKINLPFVFEHLITHNTQRCITSFL